LGWRFFINCAFRWMTLTAVNLEGPITEAPTNTTKPVSFSFDEEPTLGLLRSMNVDIAGLANNHMDDAGEQGKQDTLDALKRGTITAAGFPESCSIVPIVNGTMGVCSMADLNGLLDIDRAQEAIRDATRTTDFVIASVHWGQEYAAQPSDRQRDVAKAFVAAGADAVIGHGPHVRQPMELVDGKPVFYSIGNFLFDQANPALNTGAAAALTFSADVIVGQEFPLRTVGGRPRLE
jgi:poly-gamma-glutamate synthesis protein (capsule biosynthesis protein)